MAKTLAAVSLWSALACDGGSRVAGGVPLTSCTERLAFEGLLASGQLSLTIPASYAGASDILPGRIVRLEYTDADWDEYRIEEVVSNTPASTIAVTAKSIIYDLALGDAFPTEHASTGSGMPQDTDYTVSKRVSVSEIVTWVLGFSPSYFASGTLTPGNTVVDVSANSSAPLALLLSATEGAKASTGETYYLSARRNGTTSYYIDITDLNASVASPDVRTGKNLLAVKRTYGRDVATRVYPSLLDNFALGTGTHVFVVTAVSANTYIDVEDPNGRGIPPIAADDAVNGLYWYGNWDATNGRLQAITDSAVVGNAARLSMADTSGFTVGSYGRFVTSSDTTVSNAKWVGYQDHPGLEASSGGQRRVLKLSTKERGVDNYVRNGDLSAWSGGLPTHFVVSSTTTGTTGGTVTDNTTTYLSGGHALALPATGAFTYVRQRADVALWGSASRASKWQYRMRFYHNGTVDTNFGVRVIAVGTGTDFAATWTNLGSGYAGSTWHTYLSSTFTPVYTITGGKTAPIGLQVRGGNLTAGTTEVLIDSIECLCYSDDAGSTFPDQPTFVFNTTGAWLRGVTYLRNPPITYEISLLDLSRYDEGTWPYDALVLGGPVNVTDTDLNLSVGARVTSLDRDHLKPLASRVTLSTRRDLLTNLLVTGG